MADLNVGLLVSACHDNEMAVYGAVNCVSGTSVTASVPNYRSSGWQGGCSAGFLPQSVSAMCCPFASDSFLSTSISNSASSASSSTTQAEKLPAGAFFQGCEDVRSFPQLSGGAPLSCPSDKAFVSAGAVCSASSAGLSSSVATFPSTWTASCTTVTVQQDGTSVVSSVPAQLLSGVCCNSIQESSVCSASLTNRAAGVAVVAAGMACSSSSDVEQSSSISVAGVSSAVVRSVCVDAVSSTAASSSTSGVCLPSLTPGFLASNISCLAPTVAVGTLSSRGQVPYGKTLTLSCPPFFYLEGPSTVVCTSSGQFSADIGRCSRVDQSSCQSVTSSTGSSSTISCPSDGQNWLMVSGGGTCPQAAADQPTIQLSANEPISSTTWYAQCTEGVSNVYPAMLSAVCCVANQSPLFTDCSFVGSTSSNAQCGTEQFVLSAGTDWSVTQRSTYTTHYPTITLCLAPCHSPG